MSDPVARLNAALEGRYAIDRELGEGGMATVYLAKDLKHNRNVALKVLKPELAAVVGAERFLAEIQVTANLQHPNILPLHDSGEADGFLFYVMPYVEGDTLKDRLDREHQLPVADAVDIATDMAEALDYAHRQGVIHRDIKPANVLLLEGKPVISDFGIALAVGAAGGGRLTETGLSLGTPHYMSPEQATGDQTVGGSTDTYALGSVLYEMLVGEPPYPGTTAQAVLGKIIAGKTVSTTEHRPSVPANVDAAIRKALEKMPADRFTPAQDFARALGDEHFRYGELTASAGAAVGPWKRLTMAMTALAAVYTLGFGWLLLRPEPPAPVARFSSPFEEGQLPLSLMEFAGDGSALVYAGPGESGQIRQLWIRRWADLDATPIRGTDGAFTFKLSPDGREVAFSAFPGPLRVVALDGGPSRTLVESVRAAWGWTPDGNVYFTSGTFVLGRVPATDGGSEAVEIVTERLERETSHGLLTVLPGGKMGVFQVWYALNGEDAEVWAIDLDTRERRFLVAGHSPRYASTGHLLFGTPGDVLMAAPIDPATAELTSPSVPVAEGLAVAADFGNMNYAVSEDGTLLYRAGGTGATAGLAELVWVTRSGDATPVDPGWTFRPPPRNYGWRLSPDGSRVALTQVVDENEDIWIKELPDGPFERLTFDDARDRYAVWTPDGQFVTYARVASVGYYEAWRRRADGTGVPERLIDDDTSLAQGRWSPDGEWMVFCTGALAIQGPGQLDIVSFRPGRDTGVMPLVATAEFAEQDPALSPDGRWLAYATNETGRLEVYVSPFPDVDSDKVRVSIGGGSVPLWAHSGTELFFMDLDQRLIATQVTTAAGFSVVQRETLFTLPPGILASDITDFYDIAPDDQRFLMARRPGGLLGGADDFILVQNFFEELRQRMGN